MQEGQNMGFNIAIDGPAGAGKSTVAKMAAGKLEFIYVDTGAMYRTIALYLIRNGIDEGDEAALEKALQDIDVRISYQDGVQHMYLNGEDVSGLIRTPEVSEKASRSSAQPVVRKKLLDLQRNLARKEDVLMDGRDIGTAILPDADLKIYLTASVDVRARRRYLELKEKGQECPLEQIRQEIEERDYRDMHRDISPLCQAKDAILLDTSDIDAETAAGRIVSLAKERMDGK
jgi:cytidylate kinase